MCPPQRRLPCRDCTCQGQAAGCWSWLAVWQRQGCPCNRAFAWASQQGLQAGKALLTRKLPAQTVQQVVTVNKRWWHVDEFPGARPGLRPRPGWQQALRNGRVLDCGLVCLYASACSGCDSHTVASRKTMRQAISTCLCGDHAVCQGQTLKLCGRWGLVLNQSRPGEPAMHSSTPRTSDDLLGSA